MAYELGKGPLEGETDEEFEARVEREKRKVGWELLAELNRVVFEKHYGQDHHPEEYGMAEGCWREYPWAGLAYGPRDGCLNESGPFWNDEDITCGIYDMFWQFYAVVRDRLEQEFGLSAALRIVIEASWQDSTDVFVLLGDRVVFEDGCKAWGFQFAMPSELAVELDEAYVKFKAGLSQATDTPVWRVTESEVRTIAVEVMHVDAEKLTPEVMEQAKKSIEWGFGECWVDIIQAAVSLAVYG